MTPAVPAVPAVLAIVVWVLAASVAAAGWYRCHQQLKAERDARDILLDIARQRAIEQTQRAATERERLLVIAFEQRVVDAFRAGQDHILKQAHVIVRVDELRPH